MITAKADLRSAELELNGGMFIILSKLLKKLPKLFKFVETNFAVKKLKSLEKHWIIARHKEVWSLVKTFTEEDAIKLNLLLKK